jgi:hypothetical protein
MLSEREARVLRIIEQCLAADDPGFAAMMVRISPRRASRPLRSLRALLIAIAVLLATGGMVLVEAAAGPVALMFVWVVFGLRAWPSRHERRVR